MLATLTAVQVEKAPKGYSIANVTYERDGQQKTSKVMSFGGSASVFNKLVEFKDFPVNVNIVMEKNAKGYWEWKGIETQAKGSTTEAPKATGGRVVGSNYETPEERARRQVYIIRQSSISSAIELAALSGGKAKVSVEEILEVAKRFENYVMDVNLPGQEEIL